MSLFKFFQKNDRVQEKSHKEELYEITQKLEQLNTYIHAQSIGMGLSIEEYIKKAVIPYYTPFTTQQDFDLAKSLIQDFIQHPSLGSQTRIVLITLYFLKNINNIVDTHGLSSYRLPSTSIIQAIESGIESYMRSHGIENKNHYDFNVAEVQKKQAESLSKFLDLIQSIKKESKSRFASTLTDASYEKIRNNRDYRDKYMSHCGKLRDEINETLLYINNNIDAVNTQYQQAQIKRMTRQRAMVSMLTIVVFLTKMHTLYSDVVNNPFNKEDFIVEWFSFAYPEQYKKWKETNTEMPEAWKNQMLSQMENFLKDLELLNNFFLTRSKDMFGHFHADNMLCDNFAQLLYSMLFDKRYVAMLMEYNLNEGGILSTASLLSKGYDLNAFVGEEFIRTAANYQTQNQVEIQQLINDMENTLHELKKKLIQNNWNYQKAKINEQVQEDMKKYTFSNNEDFEFAIIHKHGKNDISLGNLIALPDLTTLQNYPVQREFFHKGKNMTFTRIYYQFNEKQKQIILDFILKQDSFEYNRLIQAHNSGVDIMQWVYIDLYDNQAQLVACNLMSNDVFLLEKMHPNVHHIPLSQHQPNLILR